MVLITKTKTLFTSLLLPLAVAGFLLSGCVYRPLIDGGVIWSSSPETQIEKATPALDVRDALALQQAEPQRLLSEPVELLPEPELSLTPEVRRELQRFLGPERSFIEKGLLRREEHYSMVLQVFRDEGLPEDLLNVALIESGFRANARSPAGAVGLWQFIKPTARVYGLKIGLFSDQRKDPILSTIAAARHLRDLYQAYGDWLLALAAYNAGTGAVDRARIRAGSTDFWQIARARRLPRQTRHYVPRIIAAALIVRDLEQYGYGELVQKLDRMRAGKARAIG